MMTKGEMQLWQDVRLDNMFAMDGVTKDPIDHTISVYPSNGNTDDGDFVLSEKSVNRAKQGVKVLSPSA